MTRRAVLTISITALLTLLWTGCKKDSAGLGQPAPTPKWKLQIGEVESALALGDDDTIYAITKAGDLVAVDPAGAIKWTQTVGYTRTAPTIGPDGAIYVAARNKLVIFNRNGSLRTEQPLRMSGGYTGMAFDGTTLYTSGSPIGALALRIRPTIQIAWSVRNALLGTPLLQRDGTVVWGENEVMAVGNSFPPPLWTLPPGMQARAADENSSMYEFNMGNGYGIGHVEGMALGPDGTVYAAADRALVAIATNGSVLWKFPSLARDLQQPVVATDGTIYVVSGDSKVYAFRPDGTKLWELKVAPATMPPLLGSAGSIFVVEADSLRALRPDGHGSRWSLNLHDQVTSPTVLGSDGTLYLATQGGYLYAIPVGETLMQSSWPRFQGNVRNSGQGNLEN